MAIRDFDGVNGIEYAESKKEGILYKEFAKYKNANGIMIFKREGNYYPYDNEKSMVVDKNPIDLNDLRKLFYSGEKIFVLDPEVEQQGDFLVTGFGADGPIYGNAGGGGASVLPYIIVSNRNNVVYNDATDNPLTIEEALTYSGHMYTNDGGNPSNTVFTMMSSNTRKLACLKDVAGNPTIENWASWNGSNFVVGGR